MENERASKDDIYFVLKSSRAGIDARAVEIDGQFVVLEGSSGSLKERPSFLSSGIKAERDRLLSSGIAEKTGDNNFVLRKDADFRSPSGAAVFLWGTSRNGRTDWLVEGKGITYAEWKDNEISEAIGEASQ
ncbi:DUF4357 domain-containing protein [Aliiroseovarius sp. xm-v-225]